MAALLRACSARASTGVRNQGLITAMYDAGLRVSEVLTLRPEDVDPGTGSITVATPGRSPRLVLLSPGAFAVVGRWLDRRIALGLGPDAPLFCTLRGGPIQAPYLRALLPRLARKMGIPKRVHPRGLRDAHAARLAAEHVPPEVLQARLGYGSRVSTDRLLRRLAPQLTAFRSDAGADAGTSLPGAPAAHHAGGQPPDASRTTLLGS